MGDATDKLRATGYGLPKRDLGLLRDAIFELADEIEAMKELQEERWNTVEETSRAQQERIEKLEPLLLPPEIRIPLEKLAAIHEGLHAALNKPADPFAEGEFFLDPDGWVRQSEGRTKNDQHNVCAKGTKFAYPEWLCTPLDWTPGTCELQPGDVVNNPPITHPRTVLAVDGERVGCRYVVHGESYFEWGYRQNYRLVRRPPKEKKGGAD